MTPYATSTLSASSKICWNCKWRILQLYAKSQTRLFHSTELQFAGGPKPRFSNKSASSSYSRSNYESRSKSKSNSLGSSRKPSRMKLSGSVIHDRPRDAHEKGDRKVKPQPTIERFSGMNRRAFTPDMSQMKTREKINAVKRERVAREEAEVPRDKRRRPPPRKFHQMKQIAKLNTVSLRQRLDASEVMQLHPDFETFGLLPQITEALQKDALRGLNEIAPTPIQRLAMPELLEPFEKGKLKEGEKYLSYLIAAETGSGKTLAYVLPLLEAIKRNEIREKREAEQSSQSERKPKGHFYDLPSPEMTQKDRNAGKPRSIIVLPTAELVEQVGRLLKSLSYIVKFRSEEIHRDIPANIIRSRIFARPLEVVVSTPALLESLIKTNPDLLSLTTQIVVDEADSLFDRSFSPITSSVINSAPNLQKLVLCSATIPKSLDTYLHRKYPHINRLVTPNLHAVPRRVQLSVVEADKDPYKGSKELACADILNSIAKDGTEPGFVKRVVVFVNERESTEPLTKYLRARDFDAIDVNRDAKSRSALEMFTGPAIPIPSASSPKSGDAEAATTSEAATARSNVRVLVTTDISSRGIDTRTLNNVILFDVPFTSIDFIHRLGRTGRMGRRGKAYVLVDKTSNKAWVKEIKTSMFMGKSLV